MARRGRPKSSVEGAEKAVAVLRALQQENSLSDAQLGRLVGVRQSSVYRALNRCPPAWTPTLRKLNDYAEINAKNLHADEPKERIGRAAAEAWDGTDAGLVRLLRLLGTLTDFVNRRSE